MRARSAWRTAGKVENEGGKLGHRRAPPAVKARRP